MSDDEVVIEPSSDDGDEASFDQKLKKLRDELKAEKAKSAEYLAGWQRAKADYVNLTQRMRGLGEEVSKNTCRDVAQNFIPVADSLEAAAKGNPGLLATLKQIDEAFRANEIVRFTPKPGEPFDPARHESVSVLATSTLEEDNTVSECLQSGYEMEGEI